MLIVIDDPVTGEIAVPREFENALPNACSTPAVFDFLLIRIATNAMPTIARKIEKKLSIAEFMMRRLSEEIRQRRSDLIVAFRPM